MSAKSDRQSKDNASNGQVDNQSASDLPEIDNSDFAENAEDEQIYESVSVQEDIQSTHSVGSNGAVNLENEAQTEVKNISHSASPIGESEAIEMEEGEPPPLPPQSTRPPTSPQVETNSPDSELSSVHHVESISAKVDSANSLYDSNEKLVFSRSTNSEYSFSGGEQTTFWKNIISIFMMPYAALGVPVASIGALASQPDRVNTGQQWLKFLFSTKAAMIVNSLEAFLVVLLNLYILFLFLGPLYTLLWYGQMTEQLVSLAVHLYEIIPLIVGLNMVWPKGYSLGNIIRLLDVKVPSKDSESMRQAYMSLTKAVIALGSLLLITLASLVSFEWKGANYYMTETRIDFYYHLVARFFLFLLIPVYLAIVSGLHFRIRYSTCKTTCRTNGAMLSSFVSLIAFHPFVRCLNTYIRSMSEDLPSISMQDFNRVKSIFKQNADVVCKINAVFNFLLSDVLLIVVISILKDIFQLFMLVASLDSFAISFEKGARHPDPEMIATASKWMAIDAFVVIAKCTLIGLTARKIKATNREIKRILTHLHDLASQYIEKPSEIYQSFCLVKYYIKARNEGKDNPAVLRLYASKWIPCVRI